MLAPARARARDYGSRNLALARRARTPDAPPRFNEATGLLEPSRFSLSKTGPLGKLIVAVLVALRIVRRYPASAAAHKKGAVSAVNADEVSNLTLINCLLVWFGPMHERTVTILVMLLQVLGTLVALAVRYPLASTLYA